jgi:C-methyltransferase
MSTNAHTRGQKFWEDFARATAEDAVPTARLMLRALGGVPRGSEVLDLACGSGGYGATFARAGARVTLLDQANVLRVTRKLVRARVRYLEGDLWKTPFGGPYDVILASHVFHHFDPRECGRLAKKIADALKPDGRVMIQEFVPDERRAKRAQPLMFGVTMLVWTRAGDAYRVSDYRKWFAAAGLRRLRHFPIHLPGDFMLASR